MPENRKKVLILFIALSVFIWPGQALEGPRVVSLAPSITEILFAIGLDEGQIVGVVDYSDYPQAAKKIPRVGSMTTINIERIIALKPDYIFSIGTENSPLNARLKAAALNITVLNPQGIGDIFSNILTIGGMLGREKEAREIVGQMQERLKAVTDKAEKLQAKKRVYIEIWDDPITSCGKGSLQDEVIRYAGGDNITKDIPIPYPNVSQEFVIKADPDVIILGYMSRAQGSAIKAVSGRFGWKEMKAVKSNKIICDIDASLFLKPSPRILNGVEEIYKRLYGDN